MHKRPDVRFLSYSNIRHSRKQQCWTTWYRVWWFCGKGSTRDWELRSEVISIHRLRYLGERCEILRLGKTKSKPKSFRRLLLVTGATPGQNAWEQARQSSRPHEKDTWDKVSTRKWPWKAPTSQPVFLRSFSQLQMLSLLGQHAYQWEHQLWTSHGTFQLSA